MSKVVLGHTDKPCIIYNLNGYYDHLRALLSEMVSRGLADAKKLAGIKFAADLDEIKTILGF